MLKPRIVPLLAAALLTVVTLLSWIWIVPMARDMYGPMTGPSAWMMRPAWDARYTLLIWLMWAVMMAAMMLPTAAPLVMLYARATSARDGAVLRLAALIAGYLSVWGAFSAAATALQRFLSASLMVTPMMEMANRRGAGALLVLAGAYQFTPAKIACLRACRSPMSFVMRRTGAAAGTALRLGLEHGAYCLGCCWALMLLLFAGGIMNLSVILALTAVVLLEKVAPFGDQTRRILGVALLATGAWTLWS